MSHPFFGKEFSFKQPNGEILRVRGWGDQFNARFETLDGFTVIENPDTGFFEYTNKPSAAGELHPSGRQASPRDTDNGSFEAHVRPSPSIARTQAANSPLFGKPRWQQRREEARTVGQTD